jgi:hypothetical protein
MRAKHSFRGRIVGQRAGYVLSAFRGDAQLSPAHIGHGYVTEELMIQVGLTAVVDRLGEEVSRRGIVRS